MAGFAAASADNVACVRQLSGAGAEEADATSTAATTGGSPVCVAAVSAIAAIYAPRIVARPTPGDNADAAVTTATSGAGAVAIRAAAAGPRPDVPGVRNGTCAVCADAARAAAAAGAGGGTAVELGADGTIVPSLSRDRIAVDETIRHA